MASFFIEFWCAVCVVGWFSAFGDFDCAFGEFFWQVFFYVISDSDEVSPLSVLVFDEESDVAVFAAELAADVTVEAHVVVVEPTLGDDCGLWCYCDQCGAHLLVLPAVWGSDVLLRSICVRVCISLKLSDFKRSLSLPQ